MDQKDYGLTTSLAGRPPTRRPIDPMICYMAEGYIEGLKSIGFDTDLISVQLLKQLINEKCFISDEIWYDVNLHSIEEQAIVIDQIIRTVHLRRALYLANENQEQNGPLGSLVGREHEALPIWLTGAHYYKERLRELMPSLPILGLDKGAVVGKTGENEYPTVMNMFYHNRKQFFRVYKIGNDYGAMVHFLQTLSSQPNLDWPEALALPFRKETTAMDAVNQIAIHYF